MRAFLGERRRSRLLEALFQVRHKTDQHEHRDGDDQETDYGIDEQPIIERDGTGSMRLRDGVIGRRCLGAVLEYHEQIGKIHSVA